MSQHADASVLASRAELTSSACCRRQQGSARDCLVVSRQQLGMVAQDRVGASFPGLLLLLNPFSGLSLCEWFRSSSWYQAVAGARPLEEYWRMHGTAPWVPLSL